MVNNGFSKKKTAEFRERLTDMLFENKAPILSSIVSNGDSADKSASCTMMAVSVGLIEIERDKIKQINYAKIKMADGTYGLCEDCNDQISEARLDINPQAILCVICQKDDEEQFPSYSK